MSPILGVVEAGAGGAAAVDIDLGDFGKVGQPVHDGNSIVVVPAEEVHAACFDFWGYVANDIEFAIVGRAELVKNCVSEISGVVVVERAAGKRGISFLAVIGERNRAVGV